MTPAPYPERIPALVTGTGTTALGVMRSLGRHGIPVFAASDAPSFERASQWYRRAPGDWRSGTLEERLRRCPLERAVLVPTSDTDAIQVACLPEELRQRFPSSCTDAATVRSLVDKDRFAALLRAHDVPHPRTWSIDTVSDIEALHEDMGDMVDRVFLKPRDSIRFMARFNRKSVRAVSLDALLSAYTSLASDGFEMVLQEYISGPPTNDFLIDGFIDRHGETRGLFARQRVRRYPLDFGNSSAMRSVDRGRISEAEGILLGFLGAIGYRGIFNAEFRYDERDGVFKLIEINPRAWWYVEFAARCGVDTAKMAYEDALQLPVESSTDYEVDRTVIYPYFDLMACLELNRRGQLGLATAVRSWCRAEQVVYASDDPRPFILETGRLWRGFLGRRISRLVRAA